MLHRKDGLQSHASDAMWGRGGLVCVLDASIHVKCSLARLSPPTSADHLSSGKSPLAFIGKTRGGGGGWKSMDEVGSTVAHERGEKE